MKGETTFSFDSEINTNILKELFDYEKQKNLFTLGIDYGKGGIQSIGTFELLPTKITNFKRKKKAKRYIISNYKTDNNLCFLKQFGSDEE